MLRDPAFPDAELTTLKEQIITNLEASRSEPQAIVSRAYGRHWARNYPPDDPRYVAHHRRGARVRQRRDGRPILRDFHEDFFGASHAEVVVIGDFDPNAVRALLTERLDGWRSPKPFSDVLNLYANLAKDPTTQDFNTPDKENAFFLGGMPIEMRDSHADYPALVFGNYILGAGPASRLFGRIRGREGLSYGVGSGFNASPRSDGATFTVNAIAAPQNAAKVEASFRDELATVLARRLYRGGVRGREGELGARTAGQPHAGRRLGEQLGLWTHVGRTMAWDAEFEARVRR